MRDTTAEQQALAAQAQAYASAAAAEYAQYLAQRAAAVSQAGDCPLPPRKLSPRFVPADS